MDAEASVETPGENATEVTTPAWPATVVMQLLVSLSHSRTVSSSEAKASAEPSGGNVTDITT